jgi:hypothetical protein
MLDRALGSVAELVDSPLLLREAKKAQPEKVPAKAPIVMRNFKPGSPCGLCPEDSFSVIGF